MEKMYANDLSVVDQRIKELGGNDADENEEKEEKKPVGISYG